MYVLQSESTGRRYVGQTADLERRLAEHNDPEHSPSKFTTKHAGPWTLIHHEEYATRSEAMQRERWLKTRSGRRWLNNRGGRASPAPKVTD